MSMVTELFADLNGGSVITFHPTQPSRYSVLASHIRTDGTPGPDVHCLNEAGADFFVATLEGRSYFKVLGPSLTLYSQRDPRWRNLIYAGGLTFGQAGCYTVSVTKILSLAGYTDDPPTVAAKLREAGCFSGALLGRPDRIPDAYPRMRYDGPVDVGQDGPLRWHHGVADMARVAAELERGPCIIEVDFVPPTAKFNQHFVVAERFTEDGEDLVIADPWDGCRTQLLTRYAQDHWDLSRALYGMRLLRVKD